MVKRRVIRKRIAKRKVIKKPDKPVNPLEVAVTGKMSKLEYEQAMMDPRFKAAMMGFNAPRINNPDTNNVLRDHETKNNEIIRQLTVENDLANAKLQNQKLKTELQQTKAEHLQKLAELKVKSDNDIKMSEIQRNRQKASYDEQILKLNATIAAQKQSIEDQQIRHKQEQELSRAQHEKTMLELDARHDKDMNAVRDVTEATKQQLELANEVHKKNIELMKAHTDNAIANINKAIQPLTESMNLKTEEINNQLELLSTSINAVSQLRNAKLKLDKAQIEDFSQPIIQKLDAKAEELQSKIELNKDIYAEIKKQNDIKTRIQQLQQTVDPTVRAEYEAKLADEKVKSQGLELTKSLAESAYKARQDNDVVTREIITLGARLFGDQFDVSSIHDPSFNKALLEKEAELRSQYADCVKRLEQAKRAIKYQDNLDEAKQAESDAEARLKAVKDSPEMIDLMNTYSKKMVELQKSTANINVVSDTIDSEFDNYHGVMQGTVNKMNEIYDKFPWAKQIADRISIKKYQKPGIYDPSDFPQVVEEAKQIYDYNLKAFKSLPTVMKDFDNPEVSQHLTELAGFLRDHDIDVKQARYNLTQQVVGLQAKCRDLQAQNEELQQRAIQLQQLQGITDTNAEEAVGEFTEEDVVESGAP